MALRKLASVGYCCSVIEGFVCRQVGRPGAGLIDVKIKKPKNRWLKEPEEHDYPAAASYLSLIFDETSVARLVKKLKAAPVQKFKAKDIFRASGLPLLGVENSHVKKDQKKLLDGEKVSPLLLVRQPALGKLIVADGYHRICAVYSMDEDALIPCKIV